VTVLEKQFDADREGFVSYIIGELTGEEAVAFEAELEIAGRREAVARAVELTCCCVAESHDVELVESATGRVAGHGSTAWLDGGRRRLRLRVPFAEYQRPKR
jgi:hypothetical protein